MLNNKQLESMDYIYFQHKDNSAKGIRELTKSLKSLGVSGEEIVQYIIWNQKKYI